MSSSHGPRRRDEKTAILRVDPSRSGSDAGPRAPVLQVLLGSEPGLRIPLADPGVTFGRTVDADVVFDDEALSRRHARVRFDPDARAWELVDLGSTNGTWLNDERVERARLRDGDKIRAGSTWLKFVLLDPTEMESAQQVDRRLFRDELTGLVVERRFLSDLRVALRTAQARGRPLAVFNMDMDGLKKVNDTHGHAMGGFVIAEAGRRIGAVFSAPGQACRYGGDEFVAYLPDADADAAMTCGEAVCRAIREAPFVRGDVRLDLGITVGVALFPDDGDSAETLRLASDAALYRAKAAGRGRTSR